MINKERFIELIKNHQNWRSQIEKLSEALPGIFLYDLEMINYTDHIFFELIDSYFTEEGINWILWWDCELPLLKLHDPTGVFAYDKNNNPIIVDTLDDLWELVKDYRI